MDNKNCNGVTIIINTEDAGQDMKIGVDSSGVAITASYLLAFGFATPISASLAEHMNFMDELKAQGSSRHMSEMKVGHDYVPPFNYCIIDAHRVLAEPLPAFS